MRVKGGRGTATACSWRGARAGSIMSSSMGTLTAIAIAASSDLGSMFTAARPSLSAMLAEDVVGGLRADITPLW